MWTILLLLCLVSSFDVGTARRPLRGQAVVSLEHSDSSESSSVEHAPIRLPRKFGGDSRTRRLHIENQTGFDGKVEKIHINSDEDLPGIRAYGMPRKSLENNGHIETKLQRKIEEEVESGSRPARAIEAYGKSKEQLETNGEIERVQSPTAMRHQTRRGAVVSRVARSIDTEPKSTESRKSTEDLEAQDAKVFRPLFVYRQQLARKQHRGRHHVNGYQTYFYRRPFY
ncbi:PREDICTED: uncharacterized protein LOC107186552 [Dufourea novaeangliae]|uniref:uncharacterized protein LOC107186552 n=1 Tax=Dufourea novaeangliae TaxID=178035 RepID=UPI000767B8B9|nr:PREDICTED: uncharacterized protein LOC107186552 [Dufourea novaeangliae]